MSELQTSRAAPRPRAQALDRYVGNRIRQRRMMLGLTQHQLAELIGVTYQQAHKYEQGINRITGGRLYQTAQALGVDVNYFYESLADNGTTVKPTPQQRLLVELARSFLDISNRKHQEAICVLARALASSQPADDADPDAPINDMKLVAS